MTGREKATMHGGRGIGDLASFPWNLLEIEKTLEKKKKQIG